MQLFRFEVISNFVFFSRIGGWVEFCSLWVTSQRKGGLLINSRCSVCSEAMWQKHRQPNCVASSHVFLAQCCNLFFWWKKRHGFAQPSLQINIQYSQLLDSLHANTVNKTTHSLETNVPQCYKTSKDQKKIKTSKRYSLYKRKLLD
jgi:hypothetical protein